MKDSRRNLAHRPASRAADEFHQIEQHAADESDAVPQLSDETDQAPPQALDAPHDPASRLGLRCLLVGLPTQAGEVGAHPRREEQLLREYPAPRSPQQ